jgi:S1-C subfamily serine protease
MALLISGLACQAASRLSSPGPEGLNLSEPILAVERVDSPISQEILQSLPNSNLLAAYETALEQVYQTTNPSVVNLAVAVRSTGLQEFDLPPGHPTPEAPNDDSGEFLESGAGSGFVWDQEGHIVTNRHVIEGAEQITVLFSDGWSAAGEVVGEDVNTDLAVVKVEAPAERLKPVKMGDSSTVRVGQLAIAIGNPFGLSGTMTVGIISALQRDLPVSSGLLPGSTYRIPDILQTDAPINPGNSGGVLVNVDGEVIGVTTAIESPVRANAGIGFAVPAAIVQRVVPRLIETGQYEPSWLGIRGAELSPDLARAKKVSPDLRGAVILDVTEGGPAEAAGLLGSPERATIQGLPVETGGDIITAIDGQPVTSMLDIISYLAAYTEPGQTITLDVVRNSEEITIDVILGARPGD